MTEQIPIEEGTPQAGEKPGSGRLKILIVSMEAAPFAKVGGLADVAGALPKALSALGHDVRVVMPCYPLILQDSRHDLAELIPDVQAPPSPGFPFEKAERFSVMAGKIGQSVPVYLIRHPRHFSGAVASGSIYPQPIGAYLFFTRAVFALLDALESDWIPDVIHANDWHCGLIPPLLSAVHRPTGHFRHIGSLFTIHNLAYQGLFSPEVLGEVGLPRSVFTLDGVEFYGQVNFLKAGMVYADRVNTVSPTYAREIQTSGFGCGLEGVTCYLAGAGRLTGILNGIDNERYNPATDPEIVRRFDAANPQGKKDDRLALQQEFGLDETDDAPVVGMVTRLSSQKGLDILAAVVERLIEAGIQFVILGQGETHYEDLFRTLRGRFPNRIGVHIGFDEPMGSRIYAGSDAFLMPSHFEPCGLGQMMALRYGTIPIVRRTGGLADSVIDDDGIRHDANGFVFEGTAPESLGECMKRVQSTFLNRPRWTQLVASAMKTDFSWSASAQQYVNVYREIIGSLQAE